MKATIINVEKAVLPRFDAEAAADVPTQMVVTTVEFRSDDGELVHTQTYAQLPEDVDSQDAFQSQADAMQADLDHGVAQAAIDQQSKLADQKVAELQSLIPNPND